MSWASGRVFAHKLFSETPSLTFMSCYCVHVTYRVGLFTDLFLCGLIIPVLPYSFNERAGIPN